MRSGQSNDSKSLASPNQVKSQNQNQIKKYDSLQILKSTNQIDLDTSLFQGATCIVSTAVSY